MSPEPKVQVGGDERRGTLAAQAGKETRFSTWAAPAAAPPSPSGFSAVIAVGTRVFVDADHLTQVCFHFLAVAERHTHLDSRGDVSC
mmetsp:Transcript_87425/g.160158  ORF Transcript_87425/g.160158 Transcript_87425/m.160158 type:complete len:87 (-) Transcript_87425:593-853(-)